MMPSLNSDNEQFLKDAVATGVFPSREEALNLAVQALREKTGAKLDEVKGGRKSPEEGIKDLREWSDSHPRATHFVDDSRESIY